MTTTACSAANTVARDPLTGATVAQNASLLIGTLVPNSGDALNGIFEPGKGVAETAYVWPTLAIAPRSGVAWDVSGNQTFVVRGGAGLFFDRPSASAVYTTVQNPPNTRSVTLRYGTLQDLGSATAPNAPPNLNVFEYDTPLPASVQWNGGVQMTLPYNVALDVSYAGQHSFNGQEDVQINGIDLGWAYRADLQDPNRVGNTPTNSLVNTNINDVRVFQGYGTIRQTQARLWRTYHSIQISMVRRMKNGLQFSFADTIGLSDKASADARIEHRPDGTFGVRADQSRADELLGNQNPTAHFMKASFVWLLPRLQGRQRFHARRRAHRERLESVGSLERPHGDRLRHHVQLPERRRQPGPDRLAGLRGARHPPARRRSRRRLQLRSASAVQHGGLPRSAAEQRRARVEQRLLEGLLPADDGPRRSPARSGSADPGRCSSASTCSTRSTTRRSRIVRRR